MRNHFIATLSLAAIAITGCDDKKKSEVSTTSMSAAPAASAKPVEVAGTTFTKKSPKVGLKIEESKSTKSNMKMTAAGKDQDMQITESEKYLQTVKAVMGDAITEAEVIYSEKTKAMVGGKEEKSPIVGKTYTLKSDGTKLTVLDAKGKPAPKAEAAVIEADLKSFGKPDPMAAALPARAIKPGEKVEELSKAFQEIMQESGQGDAKISNVAFTFREAKGDIGYFDFTAKVADEKSGIAMDMKGEVGVSTTDSQMRSIKMGGPMTLTMEKPVKVNGTGTLEMIGTRKYTW